MGVRRVCNVCGWECRVCREECGVCMVHGVRGVERGVYTKWVESSGVQVCVKR